MEQMASTDAPETSPFVPRAALEIIGASIVLAVSIELVSWLIVYRTSAYLRIKADVEHASKRLEESSAKEGGDKKKKKLEDTLKKATAEIFWLNARVIAVNLVSLFFAYRYITARYSGTVVGKLPFEPFQFFTRMTHASIKGEDYTDCAPMFIYVLCQGSVRVNIQKFLGMGPSRRLIKLTSIQSIAEKSHQQ